MALGPDEVRLDFMYDFEKREFILQFESRDQAATYQSKNNEGRILDERRYDVWLPHARGMTGLRSSSVGMAVIFESQQAADRWQKQTVLGSLVTFDGNKPGVYFKRKWVRGDLEKEIGNWRASLRPPSGLSRSNTRPNSSQGSKPFDFNAIDVTQQRGSSKEWKF